MSDRLGELGAFCALTPVADAGGLRTALDGLGRGDDSPFAALPGTHFARLVVLGDLRREAARQPADALGAPQLMFSAFFDGDAEPYLAALCRAMPAEAHAVWRHCRGCPGDPAERPHAFRRWLLDHRVPATQVFAAYPHATVGRVREALAFRAALREFALGPGGPHRDHAAFAAFAREHAP